MENTTQKRTLEVIAAEMEVAKKKRDEFLKDFYPENRELAAIWQNELASLRNEYALLELSNTIAGGFEEVWGSIINK